MNDKLLPPALLEKAEVSPGGELSWRKEDFESVVIAAKKSGLASIGGKIRFVFPDGTCELYWVDYYSESRKQDEKWEDYVERSADEVLEKFRWVCLHTDFEKEANNWKFIKKKIQNEKINPLHYLWFLCMFEAEKAR
jgi:hypothetical protein